MTDGPPRTYCECTPITDRRFDDDTPPTVAVVEALAAARSASPTDLEPLNDAVDCEALDRLCQAGVGSARAPALLSFTVDGLNVFVRDDGAVRVCDPNRMVESAPVFERPLAD